MFLVKLLRRLGQHGGRHHGLRNRNTDFRTLSGIAHVQRKMQFAVADLNALTRHHFRSFAQQFLGAVIEGGAINLVHVMPEDLHQPVLDARE